MSCEKGRGIDVVRTPAAYRYLAWRLEKRIESLVNKPPVKLPLSRDGETIASDGAGGLFVVKPEQAAARPK